jgi:hypothetical protein
MAFFADETAFCNALADGALINVPPPVYVLPLPVLPDPLPAGTLV